MQVTAVVGSLTDGEIARRAMSVSCRTPKSTSWAKFRSLVIMMPRRTSSAHVLAAERGQTSAIGISTLTKSPGATVTWRRDARSSSAAAMSSSPTCCT